MDSLITMKSNYNKKNTALCGSVEELVEIIIPRINRNITESQSNRVIRENAITGEFTSMCVCCIEWNLLKQSCDTTDFTTWFRNKGTCS